MRSALFVDFDNVFSQLRQLQPEAAERFARHPGEWIAWVTGSLELPEPHEDGERRRLLVRRCYLNPNWYQTYRHAFLRAGFEIVDCPPVTSQGKTSTDIHMVLDIIELLQHETRCDEFIVFSADADFTPVLRKLRRYDRRTTVLAIGFPSAAYQASADLLIDERLFLKEALRFGPAGSEISMPPGGPTQDAGDVRPPDTKQAIAEVSPAPAAVNAGKPDASTKTTPRLATAEELSVVATRIWATLDDSSLPISAGLLASRLRQEHPDIMDNWNGNVTFKAFFRSLGLSRLIWVSGAGGRILDPCRHDVNIAAVEQDPESPWSANGETFNVIREVCALTGAPMLSPQDLRLVINTLAQVLAERGFEPATTAQQVCRRCLDTHGVRVRQRDITFLVRGMQMNGHVFGQGKDDEATLAARLVNQVLFLCEREQKVLNTNEIVHIAKWINVKPVIST